MSLILQVRTGLTRGCKVTLAVGETRTFGRTQDADFVFHQDQSMSSKHFSISVTEQGCHFVDLGSTNGSSINGSTAREAWLGLGDNIVAGTTAFSVDMLNEQTSNQPDQITPQSAQQAAPSSAFPPPPSTPPAFTPPPFTSPVLQKQVIQGQFHSCPSGKIRFECNEQRPVQDAIQAVKPVGELYWILSAKVLSQLGDAVHEFALLFDWLPADIAQMVSPRVAVLSDELQSIVLQNHWPKDDLVGVVSTADPQQVIKQLKELMQSDPNSGELADGVCDISSPAALRSMLENLPAPWAGSFDDTIQLSILPASGDVADWVLVAEEEHRSSLESCGISGVSKTVMISPVEQV